MQVAGDRQGPAGKSVVNLPLPGSAGHRTSSKNEFVVQALGTRRGTDRLALAERIDREPVQAERLAEELFGRIAGVAE